VAGEASADRTVDEEELEDALRDAAVCDLDAVAARWSLTPSAREQVRELYETWRAWWAEFVPDGSVVRYEVPYAFDTVTWRARELPSKGPRAYSAASYSEVTCTVDALIQATDGTVTVVDLKTGRRRHPRAAEHAQLAVGAMCASGVLRVDSVQVVLAKILPGVVYADAATLEIAALDERALRLAKHLESLPTAQPVPGAHCAECYCPLLGACEGPRALARRAPELVRALPQRVETEAQAAAVLASHKPLAAWLDMMKRSARDWAEAHGGRVNMPDGSVMRLAAQERRTLDAARALPVLRARLGAEAEALVKVKESLSVTDVERAVAATVPGKKREDLATRKRLVAGTMAELEAVGALKAPTFRTWEAEEEVV